MARTCLTPESTSDIKENESTSVFIIYNAEQNVISRTIKVYYQDIFAQKGEHTNVHFGINITSHGNRTIRKRKNPKLAER